MGPSRCLLDARRWHFAHGPIELVIEAEGPGAEAAHERAWRRFQTVLTELVAELPRLRQPVHATAPCPVQGVVARRMWQACAALPTDFITPMAAVAGAVAQELLQAYEQADVHRAYVNNGGDIALHLTPTHRWRVGCVADIARATPTVDGHIDIGFHEPVRGVATSGWRGRSHSLGIADAVTVLAATAAQADAAATVVANAVDLKDERIVRAPARSLREDSDLGDRLVTVDVPCLPPPLIERALQAGLDQARRLQAQGHLHAAVLQCQGRVSVLSPRQELPRAA